MKKIINKDGKTRIVFIFEKIVIKIPRLFKNSNKVKKEDYNNFKKTIGLFGNMIINFNEFIFYLLFRPNFCLPTYFSFFGLFNIQKRGINVVDVWQDTEKYKISENLVKNKLDFLVKTYYRLLLKRKSKDQIHIPLIAHNILSPNSLYFNKDQIQLADYGDLCVIRFLLIFKDKLS